MSIHFDEEGTRRRIAEEYSAASALITQMEDPAHPLSEIRRELEEEIKQIEAYIKAEGLELSKSAAGYQIHTDLKFLNKFSSNINPGMDSTNGHAVLSVSHPHSFRGFFLSDVVGDIKIPVSLTSENIRETIKADYNVNGNFARAKIDFGQRRDPDPLARVSFESKQHRQSYFLGIPISGWFRNQPSTSLRGIVDNVRGNLVRAMEGKRRGSYIAEARKG